MVTTPKIWKEIQLLFHSVSVCVCVRERAPACCLAVRWSAADAQEGRKLLWRHVCFFEWRRAEDRHIGSDFGRLCVCVQFLWIHLLLHVPLAFSFCSWMKSFLDGRKMWPFSGSEFFLLFPAIRGASLRWRVCVWLRVEGLLVTQLQSDYRGLSSVCVYCCAQRLRLNGHQAVGRNPNLHRQIVSKQLGVCSVFTLFNLVCWEDLLAKLDLLSEHQSMCLSCVFSSIILLQRLLVDAAAVSRKTWGATNIYTNYMTSETLCLLHQP